MPTLKRIYNIMRYGVGRGARKRKQAQRNRERQSRFESDLWQHDEELAQRRYNSYGDYVDHQSSKLDKILHRLQETEQEDFTDFHGRFSGCKALNEARSVLCLGARLGTEVKALHSLGYFAIGIDLNPGSDNAYVLPGDFHNIVFPDESLDAIYTNALDHAFDLEKIVGEIKRLLHPNGLFIADLLEGFEEGFVPGAFESTHWANSAAFIEKLQNMGGFSVVEERDLGHKRRDRWTQVVFRKPA